MEELKTQSSSHVPLVTRLDHLDHVMKSLEARQDISKWAAKTGDERHPFSLDSVAREAYFKGSLMDRVAILERRLFQLCIEMEINGRSSGPGTSSGSKSNVIHFQDVIATNHSSQVIKEKPKKKEEKKKDSKAKEEKNGKNRNKGNGGEEKPAENGGKKTTAKWPHMKILGC